VVRTVAGVAVAACFVDVLSNSVNIMSSILTLYRMVMPIGTPSLKEKINN